MENIAYVMGFLVGLGCVFIAGTIFRMVAKKKQKDNFGKYDERQELARGKAYKVAFLTLMIYNMVIGLINVAIQREYMDLMSCTFLGVCISLAVFVTICVWNDAYYSLAENTKNVMIMFGFVAILNLFIAGLNAKEHVDYFTDGKLNHHVINLFMGILFLYLFVVMLIKQHKNKIEE